MAFSKLLEPIFGSFIKNKWQSKNNVTRKKAVQELPISEQSVLFSIANTDKDESIKIIATNKLTDLDSLQTIIMKGTNENVKNAAKKRLFQFLSGEKHPIPALEVRTQLIQGSRNSDLLEYIAEHAEQASLRELTIKKISRDPLLGNIALNDSNANIRLLAAQQIAKRSTLERVTKNSRRKDKRVYKIVKTKLDRIIEDEQRPALLAKEVVDICDKLEKLYQRNLLIPEQSTFENYVSRWQEIQNFSSEETKQRFATIQQKITQAIEQLQQDKDKENNALKQLEQYLETLSSIVDDMLNIDETKADDAELLTQKKHKIEQIKVQWYAIIHEINNTKAIEKYESKLTSILNLIDNKDTDSNQNSDPDINKTLLSLNDQAKSLLKKSGFILEKTVAVLEQKFGQKIDNYDSLPNDIQEIQDSFSQTIKTLNEHLKDQKVQSKQFRDKMDKQFVKINELLSNGHVSLAEQTLNDGLKQIDQSKLISNLDKQHYHDKFNAIQLQLGDLSSWRNWAHDHERVNLAEKAELLAEQAKASQTLAEDYTDITATVKDYRSQWKKMRSHSQEELWQQFNNACNLAYEQCIPFIEQQNATRQKNLVKKEALCQQIEDYIQSMNWPSNTESNTSDSTPKSADINWIQVDKIVKQARKEWSAIGHVERKIHKSINRRFDQSIEIIRHELKTIWQIHQDQFYQLIQQAEDLSDTLDEDLSSAIKTTKSLQQQWKSIGPVSSYQRNKLWKKFRLACDVVFDKRQEKIEEKDSLNTEKLQEKEAICENLEALNQQPLKINDLKQAYKDIDSLWTELRLHAKAISCDVNKRYKQAVSQYNEKIEFLLAEQKSNDLKHIFQQSALCLNIEQETDIQDGTIEQYQQQWQMLNENTDTKLILENRFNQAISNITEEKPSLIEAEVALKNNFCLQYEILLGCDSPEEFQQDRMKKQVELLNSNMGNNDKQEVLVDINNIQEAHYQLQILWHQFSNYANNEALEQRFAQLITIK